MRSGVGEHCEAALQYIQHKARELSSRTLLLGVVFGCLVRVHGLKAKPEFNGQEGTILSRTTGTDSDRWEV